ncbi:hypothetical protein HDU80_001326, partial [Chytriomyces hyalinus]
RVFQDDIPLKNKKRKSQETAVDSTPTKLTTPTERNTSDENLNPISWMNGALPLWFKTAQTKYFALHENPETDSDLLKALYWRILNLANYKELKSFLCQSDIKDIAAVFSASLKAATPKVQSNAETVLQALEELLADELIEISRTVILNGCLYVSVPYLEELKSFLKPQDIKFVRDIFSKS